MTAWPDYLDARRRLVHEWGEQGVGAEDIALRLEVDTEHVERILRQPLEPTPGTARALVVELRMRIVDLEQALHDRRAVISTRPPPVASDIRGLLAHVEPALCGCQHWVERDGMTTPDAHDARCIFARHPER
jgi:hypothetical protein